MWITRCVAVLDFAIFLTQKINCGPHEQTEQKGKGILPSHLLSFQLDHLNDTC